jgi:hypothetical protein
MKSKLPERISPPDQLADRKLDRLDAERAVLPPDQLERLQILVGADVPAERSRGQRAHGRRLAQMAARYDRTCGSCPLPAHLSISAAANALRRRTASGAGVSAE